MFMCILINSDGNKLTFLKINLLLQLINLRIEHIDVNESIKRYWDYNLHMQRFKPLKSNVVHTCLRTS